jgi:hypothetical protein
MLTERLIMGKKSVVVSMTTDNKVTTSYRNFSLGELAEILEKPALRFEVVARPDDVGGGWKLTLYEGPDEMGGGVFPAGDEGQEDAYREGFNWQYRDLV